MYNSIFLELIWWLFFKGREEEVKEIIKKVVEINRVLIIEDMLEDFRFFSEK